MERMTWDEQITNIKKARQARKKVVETIVKSNYNGSDKSDFLHIVRAKSNEKAEALYWLLDTAAKEYLQDIISAV